MKRGTIVLTKFPFTDLKSYKRRPAIVVSKEISPSSDVIVAFITSIIPEDISATDLLFEMSRRDFSKSGLLKTSIIKLDKLATLNTLVFSGELGSVSETTLAEINRRLKLALDLK